MNNEWINLLSVLPADISMNGYCTSISSNFNCNYMTWEDKIAGPALQNLGYSNIEFFTIEADSFGPLSRGVRVTSSNGEKLKMMYG